MWQFKIRQPIHWVILLVAVMLLAGIARVLPSPRNVDDSFITFRYSRQLVSGAGLVYNEGVRTLGTTTPLYALMMAGVAWIARGEAFPWYALGVNTLADMLNVCLLYWIVWRVTRSLYPSVAVAVLYALSPMSVTFAVGGMETSLAILWMLGATVAYLEDRPLWVGVLAGLGLLTRIDAAIWILPLGLMQWLMQAWHARQSRAGVFAHLAWKTWLAGLLTILPWVLFASVYFGSPIPNSLSAKSVAYRITDYSALVSFVQQYATLFQDFEAFGSAGAMIGAVLYPTLNLFSWLYVRPRQARVLPLLLYPWLYLILFAVVNPLVFRWYWLPPIPVLMLGAVLGAWAIFEGLAKLVKRPVVAQVAMSALLLLWGSMTLQGWTFAPDHGAQRPAPIMAWHELELHYRTVAEWLRANRAITMTTRIASADIGAIGYYTRATIIDTVGLVTPELSRYYPIDADLIVGRGDDSKDVQNYAIPPQLILDEQPQYLVTMEAFVRLGLLREPSFMENYTLIYSIPTTYYGSGVQVYERNALAP